MGRYVPPASVLGGLSVESAQKFGMPHFMASYTAGNDSHALNENACCAWCGMPASNSHHEPPKGIGGRNRTFFLRTEMGAFILRPALIALCGSGTTGCHSKVHSGRLRISWMWGRQEYAERWWSGWYLTHGFIPHDERFYELGYWIVEDMKTGAARFVKKGATNG